MTSFICEKYDVEHPNETMTFGKTEHVVFDLSCSNVFFVGLCGSGKSTLGQQVASRLDAPFVDTDRLVEQQAQRSVREIVEQEGWERFRAMESRILEEVCRKRGQIVATGGGIILSAQNRDLLQQNGTTLYLMGNPPLLASRLGNHAATSSQRPLVSDQPLEETMSELMWEREPLYMMVAAHTLQADKEIQDLVKDTLTALWPEQPGGLDVARD